tara:strand:+ start:5279 stop:6250 length:972 start_codon:yes stop_codon:yes gene_type:complete
MLMSYKPIIIVAGEPNSIFIEIFLKSLKYKKYKSNLILICSFDILKLQMKKLNIKKKINFLKIDNLNIENLDKNKINLFNIKYSTKKAFDETSKKSKKYIDECFQLALKLLKSKITNKFINGPISKKHFLNSKLPGITEYLAKKTHTKKFAMLIYNKNLSVCPLTTHIPIKNVSQNIVKNKIFEKVKLITSFYKHRFKKSPRIAILGLNPHCESFNKFDEDQKITIPAVKSLKRKGFSVSGPYSADTVFIKENRKKFEVILGMYHDQVLSPLKTLYEYDAINITLGLPFTRVSPDHGPNKKMLGKNTSNPLSLIRAISFLDKN